MVVIVVLVLRPRYDRRLDSLLRAKVDRSRLGWGGGVTQGLDCMRNSAE